MTSFFHPEIIFEMVPISLKISFVMLDTSGDSFVVSERDLTGLRCDLPSNKIGIIPGSDSTKKSPQGGSTTTCSVGNPSQM